MSNGQSMQLNLQPQLSKTESILLALCVLVELLALANLFFLPSSPLVPLGSLLVVLLVSALLDKRVMFVILLLAIFASESLYVELGTAVVRLIDLVIIFLLAYLALQWLAARENTLELLPIFKVPFALLVLGALISFVGTLSVGNTILELIQIIELIIAAFIFFNLIKTKEDINFIFIATLIYSVLDSFWILNKYVSGQLIGRAIGLFGTLGMELPYGLALSASYFYLTKKSHLKIILLLCGMVQIMAIFLTRGRGQLIIAFLMVTICSLLLALNRKNLVPFLMMSGFLILASAISYRGLPSAFQERISSIVEGGQMRDIRLIIWAIALKVWRDYPVFGVGFGNGGVALNIYAPKPYGITLTALFNVEGPHSEYLSYAVQGGLIGFTIGILFYLFLLAKALQNYFRKRSSEYSIILLSFVIGILVFNFANDTLLAGNGMFIILVMAMISRIYVMTKN